MTVSGEAIVFTRRATTPDPEQCETHGAAEWWWHRQVLYGMMRELIVNGWPRSDVSRSLYRAIASTRTRCLTQATARRESFLLWTLRVVGTDWMKLENEMGTQPLGL